MEKTIDEKKGVNPEKIFQTYFAHIQTGVLVTSVDLEVYTHINNGHSTAIEIAKAAKASPRGMEILLNSLVALNFLTKSGNTYKLTPLAERFLVKDNPAYMGDWVQTADMNQKDLMHLTYAVRTGKYLSNTEQEAGEEYFKKLVPSLFPVVYPSAKAAAEALGIGKTWKNLDVLDVGAGSGARSIAFAELDAGTKVTALDFPGILEISEFIPDDERSSAVMPLLFATIMLITSNEGDTFTMKEYREWLQGAGFQSIATIDIPGPSPLIIASK